MRPPEPLSREALLQEVVAAHGELLEKVDAGIGNLDPVPRLVRLCGYERRELEELPPRLLSSSFGCGDPVAVADLRGGHALLDVGCGAGLDLLRAAKVVGSSGTICGVDAAAVMVHRARAHLEGALVGGLELEVGLAEALPGREGAFDRVLCNNVLPTTVRGEAIAEMTRVLRPGGLLVVCDLVAGALPSWISMSKGLRARGVAGASALATLEGDLAAAGLVDVTVRSEDTYDAAAVETLIDGGLAGVDLPGCSASGAIMGSEAAALLGGSLGAVTVTARRAS